MFKKVNKKKMKTKVKIINTSKEILDKLPRGYFPGDKFTRISFCHPDPSVDGEGSLANAS